MSSPRFTAQQWKQGAWENSKNSKINEVKGRKGERVKEKEICVRVPPQLVRLADKAVFDGRDSTDASLNVAR